MKKIKEVLEKKKIKGDTENQKRMIGENNPMWKGDDVGYGSLHDYIKWHYKKPNKCGCCGKKTEFLDLANISGKYKRDINDFEWLCRKCHMIKDGRLEKLKKSNPYQSERWIKEHNIKTKCDYCGNEIIKIKSQFDKHKHHFCNLKCFGLFKKYNNK